MFPSKPLFSHWCYTEALKEQQLSLQSQTMIFFFLVSTAHWEVFKLPCTSVLSISTLTTLVSLLTPCLVLGFVSHSSPGSLFHKVLWLRTVISYHAQWDFPSVPQCCCTSQCCLPDCMNLKGLSQALRYTEPQKICLWAISLCPRLSPVTNQCPAGLHNWRPAPMNQ